MQYDCALNCASNKFMVVILIFNISEHEVIGKYNLYKEN